MIIFALIFLSMLLFFPGIAMEGSRYGASLWLSQLLPTLLPFFIAIRLFDICLPKVSGSRVFLLTGLLCGYPAGAALVANQYERGLSLPQTYFYLGFVNNPSPMFILVFCCGSVLKMNQKESVLFFSVLLLSSFVGSLLFLLLFRTYQRLRLHRGPSQQKKTLPPSQASQPPGETHPVPLSFSGRLDKIILDSFILLVKIGGYVILFSILGQFIAVLFARVPTTALLCSGSLEITSGISYLHSSALPPDIKKVLASTILAFGGLSAAAQTGSILSKSELSLFPYILCKAVCSGIACLLSFCLFHAL